MIKEQPQPSKSEINKLLKDKSDEYFRLVDYIENGYQIKGDFKFSQKTGWTVFFRKSGKSLCYIELQESKFRVVVVIGSSLEKDVINSDITPATKLMFKNAKQYHDGRWLLFDNISEKEIEDIKKLLNIKRKIAPTRS